MDSSSADIAVRRETLDRRSSCAANKLDSCVEEGNEEGIGGGKLVRDPWFVNVEEFSQLPDRLTREHKDTQVETLMHAFMHGHI